MKRLFLLVLTSVLLSCNAIQVNYDYDKTTNFSNYSTYNYFEDIASGLSQFDEKRLLKAIDTTLQAKGFLLAAEPDFLIDIKSKVYTSSSRNNVGVGIGGTGRSIGGGLSIGIPVGNSQLQRQILLDFVDANKNNLFWQVTTASRFRESATPLTKEQQLQQIIKKALSKFPPDKK